MMDRTTEYAKLIINGELGASQKNIQAAKRHIRDMNLKVTKYHFDVERAEKVISFIELLPVPKTMKAMKLKKFQCFIIGSLFGWVDDFGNRRFTKAYISMSRKNGKTLLLAGIAMHDLLLGTEPKYERTIAVVSNTQRQATKAWNDAHIQLQAIRAKSKKVEETTKITKSIYELINTKDRSIVKAFSREADNLEGEQISTGIIDEAHLLKDNKVYNSIKRGQTLLKNPSLYFISTSGNNLNVPFFEEYQYITKVLDGDEVNDNYFIFCAEQDRESEIHEPDTWIKSNPLMEDEEQREIIKNNLERDIKEGIAKNDLNDIYVKSFNLWRQASKETYISFNDWNACKTDSELDIKGREVYIGVDLSRSDDLTALSFVYPTDNKKYFVDSHVFVGTKNGLEKKIQQDKIDYRKLADMGLATISETDSGIIDPEQLYYWLVDYIEQNKLDVKAICYDSWESSYFVTKMEKETDYRLVEVTQDYRNMSPALKQFRLDVLEKRILHNGNPNLNLAINNAITKPDNNSNIILSKQINRNKIDALVALATAFTQAKNHAFTSNLQDYILSDDFGF